MAENTLVHRYRRYKAGTTKVVDWLANSAQDCQDVTGIIPSLRTAKRPMKQTTRSRKPKYRTLPNIKLSASQMFSLAEVVSQNSKPVPAEILSTLDSVIERRRHCAEWYAAVLGKTNAVTAVQNEGHKHFISVLKDVRRLLVKPSRTNDATRKPINPDRSLPKAQSVDDRGISNIFAQLQLDEPTANPLGSITGLEPAAKKATFELEDEKDEKEIAIWCLLRDFHDVRLEL